MEESGHVSDRAWGDAIEEFIGTQVTGRGLNERTEKAYRLDLEHFYAWMGREPLPDQLAVWETRRSQYLNYLWKEKHLRTSTISRKDKVVGYFLDYLAGSGAMEGKCPGGLEQWKPGRVRHSSTATGVLPLMSAGPKTVPGPLSRQEVDAFFEAIRREKEGLESVFRRRLCLRDQVMMKLLFYHGIEISELLSMEISDYDQKNGILTVPKRRKRGSCVRIFSTQLRDEMRRWIQEHEYLEREEEFQGRMFLSKLGRPLSMKMVILIFEKYRLLAGIEKEFTPKDLKNSLERYGRELVMEGCG